MKEGSEGLPREYATLVLPTCNPQTVLDGRGGIFTYLPEEPLVEVNLVVLKAGRVRGEHKHLFFQEYFLCVSGLGLYETLGDGGKPVQFLLSPGMMVRIPRGVPHVVHAIEDMVCLACLTRRWDDCEEPITYCSADDIRRGEGVGRC